MSSVLWYKPTLFLGSSEQARPIAEELINQLTNVDVQPWWKVFPPGVATLNALLDLATRCDFAAVLLTADDILVKGTLQEDNKNKQKRAARDNCIFELGLFLGALGLEPRRAFILTSLAQEELPTDLRGITYIKIEEEESDNFEAAIKTAGEIIQNRIIELSPPYCYDRAKQLRLIPGSHLMQMEKLKSDGGTLVKGNKVRVIVHSAQPMEKEDREFAKIVQRNMSEEVFYIYFFEADELSLTELPSLIRTLATAGLKVDIATVNIEFWKGKMVETDTNKASVRDCLKKMKDHLRIYLLENTEQVQFCIHNANFEKDAICYLSYPPHFVEWCDKNPATKMADKLMKKGSPKFPDPKQIFNGSITFDLYGEEPSKQKFRNDLWAAITEMFHEEFHQELEQACFGNKLYSGQTQQTTPERNWLSRLFGN